jgi:circadian clock protein KaiB
VIGGTPGLDCAVNDLQRLLNDKLRDGYELSVIDLQLNPHAGEADRVLATPTLIRLAPAPALRLIGDLSAAAALVRLLELD